MLLWMEGSSFVKFDFVVVCLVPPFFPRDTETGTNLSSNNKYVARKGRQQNTPRVASTSITLKSCNFIAIFTDPLAKLFSFLLEYIFFSKQIGSRKYSYLNLPYRSVSVFQKVGSSPFLLSDATSCSCYIKQINQCIPLEWIIV